MKYPQIIDEETTLNLMLMGRSIARFGDGEWRCAVGGGCTSQRPDPKLARELKDVLKYTGDNYIVGLPNPFDKRGAPREESWIRYTQAEYTNLLRPGPYHSSFITRPDNAPWIDTPEYWAKVRKLWEKVDVTLVVGAAKDGSGPEKKSITTEMIGDSANSVRTIIGPRQHAYAEIDDIEKQIGKSPGRVLLCLGTAATVLAYRLAKKGIHALDVGHIGMFLRHAGAYCYAANDLTSKAYREQLETLHASQTWGADGAKHTDAVRALWAQYQPKTTLDYGCGENKLAESLKAEIRISGYDPGIPERSKMPKPCDMVVCTDVLEHVEPSKLDAVLDHIWRLTGRVGYFVIDLKAANAILPDGRNAHLSLHPAEWWLDKLHQVGWGIPDEMSDHLTITGKSLSVVALKL
jgi:hypothetical protein